MRQNTTLVLTGLTETRLVTDSVRLTLPALAERVNRPGSLNPKKVGARVVSLDSKTKPDFLLRTAL